MSILSNLFKSSGPNMDPGKAAPTGHDLDHISHTNGVGHDHDSTDFTNGVGHEKFHVEDEDDSVDNDGSDEVSPDVIEIDATETDGVNDLVSQRCSTFHRCPKTHLIISM